MAAMDKQSGVAEMTDVTQVTDDQVSKNSGDSEHESKDERVWQKMK